MRKILKKYLLTFYHLMDSILTLSADILAFLFAPFVITDKFQYKSKIISTLNLYSWRFMLKATEITLGIEEKKKEE